MKLVNQQVTHETYGTGTVIEVTDSWIEVNFESGNKKFLYPDALGKYLFLVDREVAEQVKEVKQELEEERRAEELELQRQREQEYEERRRALELEKLIQSNRISPASQVAFWIDPEEQEQVFSEWKVFTGVCKSGANKGKPNRLARLYPNSACVITQRERDLPEQTRRVVGVFMVAEDFIGKLCDDGYIPAHSHYRIRLSEDESKQILFWNYYYNERYPDKMTWNAGRNRYMNNIWVAQMLKTLVSLKHDPKEKQFVQNFLNYFCRMNKIDLNELNQPSGTLTRIAVNA